MRTGAVALLAECFSTMYEDLGSILIITHVGIHFWPQHLGGRDRRIRSLKPAWATWNPSWRKSPCPRLALGYVLLSPTPQEGDTHALLCFFWAPLFLNSPAYTYVKIFLLNPNSASLKKETVPVSLKCSYSETWNRRIAVSLRQSQLGLHDGTLSVSLSVAVPLSMYMVGAGEMAQYDRNICCACRKIWVQIPRTLLKRHVWLCVPIIPASRSETGRCWELLGCTWQTVVGEDIQHLLASKCSNTHTAMCMYHMLCTHMHTI